MNSERERLEGVAQVFSTQKDFDGRLNQYIYRRIRPWFRGSSVLELGCADGGMSIHLPEHFEEIVIVDGAQVYIEAVERLLSNRAEYHTGLFEEVEIDRTFDTILATNILEHVTDPQFILRRAMEWLAPGGVIIVSVPNAHSLHRQAGVKMGILKHVQELSETDHRLGHRRVYTRETLRTDIEAVGLRITEMHGVFLKPLSNRQVGQWYDELQDAFFALADEYPNLATPLIAKVEK